MIIVFPNTSIEDLRAFCERLRKAVGEHKFCEETHGLQLTISVGIASSQGQDWLVLSSDEVISQADQALYTSKEGGRNQVCIWSHGAGAAEPLFAREEAAPIPAEEEASPDVRGRLLIVDDEPEVLAILQRMLERQGLEVVSRPDLKSAVDTFAKAPLSFDLVITDLSLGEGATGFDLMRLIREIDPHAVVVALTGHSTLDNAVQSLRHGAYDFIQKPVEATQLEAVVDRSLEYRRLTMENRRYQARLEDMVREKSRELQHALEQVKQSYNFTLEALVNLLDVREQATGRHSMHVREIALVLGREMGLSNEALQDLSHGALLHDIGKIGIPDSILLKPGALDPDEWEIMKTHAQIGYDVLKSSPYLQGACEIVYTHQEHYDGSGYPRGLRGEEIPLGARIFSLVDAYDAMRSNRPYRKGMGVDDAIAEMRKCSGSQFDPRVIDAALGCIGEFERIRAAEQSPPPE